VFRLEREETVQTQTAGRFKCVACGATYRWRVDWAGLTVKCRCGHVMSCPKDDPALQDMAQPEKDLYELADDPPVARSAPQTIVTRASMATPMTAAPTLSYHGPTSPSISPKADEANTIRDVWMPIWLIAGSSTSKLRPGSTGANARATRSCCSKWS